MTTRKWEPEIVAALRAADRPLTAAELSEAILGGDTRGRWTALQAAFWGAARRGVIERIGSAAHGPNRYRYQLKNRGE